MEHAEIPGMSVTIVSGDQIILQRGYGFKDVSAGTAISPSTLFEIGSNSKAFTGLAVLKLAKENRLHLDDPVSKYLPWFQPVYHNQPAVITIEQLLHHTSGTTTIKICLLHTKSRFRRINPLGKISLTWRPAFPCRPMMENRYTDLSPITMKM